MKEAVLAGVLLVIAFQLLAPPEYQFAYAGKPEKKALFGHPGGPKWQLHANEGDWSHYAKWIARKRYGWRGRDWIALWKLWDWESGWEPTADNPTSSAYGIPQCLLELHETCNADYVTRAKRQVDWGLLYIDGRYGSPAAAWRFHQAQCGGPLGCYY
jgi:hypothetical protein